jgi:hypothetical protein
MASAIYRTRDEIIAQLEARRNGRTVKSLHVEVERETGMKISYSHLFNILRGRREPNPAVMKYLGGTVEKTVSVVYQITGGRRGDRGRSGGRGGRGRQDASTKRRRVK